MSDADRLKEIEAKLHRLRTDVADVHVKVAALELHLRRQDEKLDAIILKLFAPEQMQIALSDGTLSVETPEDVETLLAGFLAERRR